MLTTKELVFQFKEDYAKNTSVDKILQYLDKVQRRAFLHNNVATIFLNGSDSHFPYPILETQEGILEYTIGKDAFVNFDGTPIVVNVDNVPLEVSEVVEVFKGSVSSNAYYDYGRVGYNGRAYGREKLIFGRAFEVMPVRIMPRTQDSDPKIIFQRDPKTKVADGVSEDVYYVECSVAPRRITSVEIPLSINTDKWEDMLIDGMLGELQKVLYGESKVAMKFEKEWLPKFAGYCNKNLNDWEPIEIIRRTV